MSMITRGLVYGGFSLDDIQMAVSVSSSFSIAKFIQYLEGHAQPAAGERCAIAIRLGLEAGGLNMFGHPQSPKDYGPFLRTKRFCQVTPTPAITYHPTVGDIMIIQPYPGGRPEGHIQAWAGTYWISDFKQTGGSAPWPGPGYRKNTPQYAVYRYL
jgi:hypothetical protein